MSIVPEETGWRMAVAEMPSLQGRHNTKGEGRGTGDYEIEAGEIQSFNRSRVKGEQQAGAVSKKLREFL